MHSAPAVSYPVGRSRFQGWLIALAGLLGGLIGGLWLYQTEEAGWRHGLFFLILFGAIAISVQGWRRSPRGTLRWDGQAWSWLCGEIPSNGKVAVQLDLQLFLLLSMQTESGTRLWLWPECAGDVTRWNALRRAVFARRAKRASQDCDAGIFTDQNR